MLLMHIIPGEPQLVFQQWRKMVRKFNAELRHQVHMNLAELIELFIPNHIEDRDTSQTWDHLTLLT